MSNPQEEYHYPDHNDDVHGAAARAADDACHVLSEQADVAQERAKNVAENFGVLLPELPGQVLPDDLGHAKNLGAAKYTTPSDFFSGDVPMTTYETVTLEGSTTDLPPGGENAVNAYPPKLSLMEQAKAAGGLAAGAVAGLWPPLKSARLIEEAVGNRTDNILRRYIDRYNLPTRTRRTGYFADTSGQPGLDDDMLLISDPYNLRGDVAEERQSRVPEEYIMEKPQLQYERPFGPRLFEIEPRSDLPRQDGQAPQEPEQQGEQ